MTIDDNANVAVFPPLAFAGAIVIGAALQYLWPIRFMQPRGFGASPVIGTVLIILAVLLVIWAMRTMRSAGTTEDVRKPTTAIVTGGPFRYSRNPMYLAMLVLTVGVGFAFSLEWVVLMVVPLWAVLRFAVIHREEAYLSQKFGDEYEMFLKSTRRWI